MALFPFNFIQMQLSAWFVIVSSIVEQSSISPENRILPIQQWKKSDKKIERRRFEQCVNLRFIAIKYENSTLLFMTAECHLLDVLNMQTDCV